MRRIFLELSETDRGARPVAKSGEARRVVSGLPLERLSKCVLWVEEFEADEAAADREEGLVDVGAALVANA